MLCAHDIYVLYVHVHVEIMFLHIAIINYRILLFTHTSAKYLVSDK